MQRLRDQVDGFASLLASHKFSSNFFGNFESKTGILEKDTHPKVSFLEMNLDAAANTAILSGVTESLEIVGQQVNLFQNDRMVKSVKLSKADINKDGKIEFTLNIVFDPGLLRSLESSK